MEERWIIPDQHNGWWRSTTVYQVYPRSFMDSNGDGVGDIPGIISRLTYIKDLGFETIWISPFYRSPQQDYGYDISDYREIAPEYGTMDDARRLIDAVHDLDMRIVFDMVFCHTSLEHPWFQRSRRERNGYYSDWYIWREGKRGGRRPPNNWKSITGKNGWHFEPRRGQWYYANFLPFQPDLNYRHPPVKKAMFDNVAFWLDRGVDGFRLDIFHAIFKDDRFRNNPFSFRIGQPVDSNDGANQIKKYTMNLPENFEFARELREFTDRWDAERLLIGEVFGRHNVIRNYLGDGQRPGLHAIFLFQLLRFTFSARFFRSVLKTFETLYPPPLVPTLVLGNHDQRRWITRLGGDIGRAKCVSLLQLTARGIPVVYYGEEIGMENAEFPLAGALDPVARQYSWVPRWLENLLGLYLNRDGCRTPMQWNGGEKGGFSTGEPWLPLHENRSTVNVAREESDSRSLLEHYRALLRIRRTFPALSRGTLRLVDPRKLPSTVVAYIREAGAEGAETCLVAINFGRRRREFALPLAEAHPIFTSDPDVGFSNGTISLPPATGIVLTAPAGGAG